MYVGLIVFHVNCVVSILCVLVVTEIRYAPLHIISGCNMHLLCTVSVCACRIIYYFQ